MTLHVAVLMGGLSVEREVSLVSGAACARALEGQGFMVTSNTVTERGTSRKAIWVDPAERGTPPPPSGARLGPVDGLGADGAVGVDRITRGPGGSTNDTAAETNRQKNMAVLLAWWPPGPRRSATAQELRRRPAAGHRGGRARVPRSTTDFDQRSRPSLPDLQAFTSSRKLFLTPDGQPLPVGTLLRNPDLAKTYQLLARYGPSYLYDGPLGADIVETVQHPPVYPGERRSPSGPAS